MVGGGGLFCSRHPGILYIVIEKLYLKKKKKTTTNILIAAYSTPTEPLSSELFQTFGEVTVDFQAENFLSDLARLLKSEAMIGSERGYT